MHKKMTFVWFLLGLGGSLQVLASLSISECIILISVPCIFVNEYRYMRWNGVSTFFWMSVLVIIGCVVACIANQTFFLGVVRGLATTTIVSSSIVFSHWIIRKDPNGFKWMFVGGALSSVISVFFFQKAVDLAQFEGDIDLMMSGPIFWIQQIGPFVTLPPRGWYIHMPMVVNVGAPIFMAMFSIFVSTSGRAAALTMLAFAGIVIIGGKTRKSMRRLSQHFWIVVCLALLGVFTIYYGYKMAAMSGILGEEARMKYEAQSQGSDSIGRLILGGRGESFIGLLACRDKPIVGWGPWAKDTNGYREEFLMRFGTMEDVLALQRHQQYMAKNGIGNEKLISCHAYITEFWVWYGIFGFVFWIYVIFVLLRYLRQDCFAVPQWFAWLACSIPGVLWGIFFSPFSSRIGVPMFIVACLITRAVRTGKFRLPEEMIREVEEAEKK